MRHYVFFQITFICLSLCGCGFYANGNINTDRVIGIVMTDGMTISIQNPDCFSLSIRAGKGLLRDYTWNNGTRSAVLESRLKKWNGHYGAYTPDYDWPFHDGINRLLAEEAVLNYRDYDQLLCALSPLDNGCRVKYFGYPPGEITVADIKRINFVNTLPSGLRPGACSAYTDDGLYVSVKKAEGPGDGGTLYVTVNLLKVAGESVKGLPGSTNERIKVVYPH